MNKVDRAGRKRARRSRAKNADVDAEIAAMFAIRDLTDDQHKYVENRWKPQLLHASDREVENRKFYTWWRLPAVIGAVTLPPLASPTVEADWARWAALVVSLVVAVCTAIEGLYRFGNRWRLYRRLLDELRSEGWKFVNQVGADYERADGENDNVARDRTFRTFVRRTEATLGRHGDRYVTDVVLGGSTGGDTGKAENGG